MVSFKPIVLFSKIQGNNRKLTSHIFASHYRKIFERTWYNNMFNFFTKNDLISHNQLGKSLIRDSCINDTHKEKLALY